MCCSVDRTWGGVTDRTDVDDENADSGDGDNDDDDGIDVDSDDGDESELFCTLGQNYVSQIRCLLFFGWPSRGWPAGWPASGQANLRP